MPDYSLFSDYCFKYIISHTSVLVTAIPPFSICNSLCFTFSRGVMPCTYIPTIYSTCLYIVPCTTKYKSSWSRGMLLALDPKTSDNIF